MAPGQWQWSVADLKAIRDERSMPPWQKIAGRMSLALIKPGDTSKKVLTWADVGAWHSELTRGRQQATPEMRRKVAELTAASTNQLSKMNALARFVQNDIRYVAIELGIGGYQPHAAADVFQHRYGDCKDMATLLASLLREVGIESYYVIINTERGAVDAQTPPNLGFNHVMLAIALPNDVDDPSLLAVMRQHWDGCCFSIQPILSRRWAGLMVVCRPTTAYWWLHRVVNCSPCHNCHQAAATCAAPPN